MVERCPDLEQMGEQCGDFCETFGEKMATKDPGWKIVHGIQHDHPRIDGLMQKRYNSSVLAMESYLVCT